MAKTLFALFHFSGVAMDKKGQQLWNEIAEEKQVDNMLAN